MGSDNLHDLLIQILPRIQRAVRFLTPHAEDALELQQTCCLEIAKSVSKFRGQSSFEAWVDRVIYRVSMRYFSRLRRRQKTIVLDTDYLEASISTKQTPEANIHRHRVAARLNLHMDRLTQEKRMAIMLKVVLGHSLEEVAQITDVSVNTVRDRLRVGLRELREHLNKDPEIQDLLTRGF